MSVIPVYSTPTYVPGADVGQSGPSFAASNPLVNQAVPNMDVADSPYWWLLSIPEVNPILQTWQQQGKSTDWLLAQVSRTNWFRTTSQSARDWQELTDRDPMTAEDKIRQTSQSVRDLADQMGGAGVLGADAINISRDLGQQALANGWSSDFLRDRVADTLAGVVNWRGGGLEGQFGQQFDTIAHDYAVPMSDQAMNGWVTQAIHGSATPDSFKAYATNMAESMYPQLKAALDSGTTVRQFFDPYVQVAAKELEINPQDVDINDPKWNKAINNVDAKTGQRTAMSLSDWTSTIRTDPKYGYDQTTGARQQAADLAASLGKMFGVSQ